VTFRNQKQFDALRRPPEPSLVARRARVDVTDEAAVRGLIDEVLAKHGSLDGLGQQRCGYAAA